MRVFFSVCLMFVLIISCNQQEDMIVSSASDQSVNQNEQLFKQPAQSGPYVVRYETYLPGFGFIVPDEKSGLTAFIAVDNEAWCSGEGLASFDIVPLMEIDIPNNPDRFIGIQKGEVKTTVHEGLFAGGDICEFVENHPMLAEGTSDIVYTDNDEFTYLNDNSINVNAFGFNAQGELTAISGESVIATVIMRSVWDGVDDSSFKSVNKVILK